VRDERYVHSFFNINRPSFSNQVVTRVCTEAGTFVSSASGYLQSIVALNVNTTSWSSWANLYPLYDEVRVLGARITLTPALPPTGGAAMQPCVVVYDNDDNSNVLATYSNGLDYRQKKIFPISWTTPQPVTLTCTCYSVNAYGPSATAWVTTNASVTAYPRSFKLYAGGLPDSAIVLNYLCELVVQVRAAV